MKSTKEELGWLGTAIDSTSLVGLKDGLMSLTGLGWGASALYDEAVSARQTRVDSQGWRDGYRPGNGMEYPNRSYLRNVKLQNALKVFGKLSGAATIAGTGMDALIAAICAYCILPSIPIS